MWLDQLISDTVSRLIGRFVRRAIAAALLSLFALVVIYHLAVAGIVALSDVVGVVYARLIIAAVFALLAGGAFAFLVSMRAKPPQTKPEDILREPRAVGLAMLLESALLGYALARGKPRPPVKRT